MFLTIFLVAAARGCHSRLVVGWASRPWGAITIGRATPASSVLVERMEEGDGSRSDLGGGEARKHEDGGDEIR